MKTSTQMASARDRDAGAHRLVLVACGDDDDDGGDGDRPPRPRSSSFPADTTMGEIQEAGEINIGVKYDVPPFGLNNPQTGEVEGFDVDLGTYIADRLGVEPSFREATSDNRIPLLVDGTIDLILSTMTITEERDLEIDFSEPYYVANGDVLVPVGLGHPDARRPQRQPGLHGARLHLPGHDQAGGARRRTAPGRPLLGVLRPGPDGPGRRGLDRQRDPDRDGDPGRLAGAARPRLHHRAVRRRDPGGRHRVQAVRRRRGRRVHRQRAPGRRPTTSGSASTSRRTSSRARRTSPCRRR